MPSWRCGGRCLAERSLRFAWPWVGGLLALGALAAQAVNPLLIDWQPALAWRQPWRPFTAVFVHYSAMHLAANLAGALLVGALGLVARVPARSVAAWLAAWPLTQCVLALQPELLHYGGLSGVLHAGVAVAAVHLAWAGRSRERWIGTALLVGLIAKIASESPWAGPLSFPPGWDIAVAPLAHAGGVVTGVLASAVAEALRRRQ